MIIFIGFVIFIIIQIKKQKKMSKEQIEQLKVKNLNQSIIMGIIFLPVGIILYLFAPDIYMLFTHKNIWSIDLETVRVLQWIGALISCFGLAHIINYFYQQTKNTPVNNQNKIKFCSKCGKQHPIETSDQFCDVCGNKL